MELGADISAMRDAMYLYAFPLSYRLYCIGYLLALILR